MGKFSGQLEFKSTFCRRIGLFPSSKYWRVSTRQGIDLDELAAQLQEEGAESLVKPWDEMMDVVASKAQASK
jgi:hypothetical protein